MQVALKKLLLPSLGTATVLLRVLLGCTRPDFSTINDTIMSIQRMQAELERLHEINSTVGSEEFDPGDYPISVGIDVRNGKILMEKFICWDDCPNVGKVFLVYQDVESAQACVDSWLGSPLFSPDPIPGQYWGCRPVVDWLNRPSEIPN